MPPKHRFTEGELDRIIECVIKNTPDGNGICAATAPKSICAGCNLRSTQNTQIKTAPIHGNSLKKE